MALDSNIHEIKKKSKHGLFGGGRRIKFITLQKYRLFQHSNFFETWIIQNQNQDTWTQSEDIHIIDNGEKIEFPVNVEDDGGLKPY